MVTPAVQLSLILTYKGDKMYKTKSMAGGAKVKPRKAGDAGGACVKPRGKTGDAGGAKVKRRTK